ncbi:shikimate kinase, partial [Elusimicrobiota bacterium]
IFPRPRTSREVRGRGKIVAVGGGAVTLSGSVSAMRRAGRVVYLQAPLSVLRRRVSARERKKRPLWKQAGRLLARRRSLYRGAAHLTVRAGRGTPREIAARIALRLGRP